MLAPRRIRTAASALALLFAAATFFGAVSTAEAGVITYWSSYGPKGTVGTNVPVTAKGNSSRDGYALLPSSAKLTIDSVVIPPSSYNASILTNSAYFYYNPQPKLTDGPHTFRVEVSDARGAVSAKEWGATVVQPPSAGWIAPASGAVLYDGRPTIVMSLADNTPGPSLTVLGQVHEGTASGPVVATFGSAGLSPGQASFTLPSELGPGIYYLTATVTDVAGNTVALDGLSARSFAYESAAAMTVLTECLDCHAAYPTAHPTYQTSSCVMCHLDYDAQHEGGPDCVNCHGRDLHAAVAIGSACTTCHTSRLPEYRQHTASSVAPSHMTSCGGCHQESLLTRHAYTPAGSVYASQCDVCHGSTDTTVTTAIAAGTTSCSGCHEAHGDLTELHTFSGMDESCQDAACHVDYLPDAHVAFVGEGNRYPQYADSCELCHANDDEERVPDTATADCATCHEGLDSGHLAIHATATSATVLPDTGRVCGDCHDSNMMTEHAKSTASSAAAKCGACHTYPRSSIVTHDDTSCAQADCHAAGTPSATHSDITTDHTLPVPGPSCYGSGCHSGTDLMDTHSLASTTTAGVTKTSCMVCHYGGIPATNDCATCHPERLLPHGYEPADHLADATCVGSCHTSAAGMTELKPLHDTASGTSFACGACHAVKVDTFDDEYPFAWQKGCDECHPVADLHPAEAASHVGTDAVYQTVSFFGNGCSTATGIQHTTQSACHDISNIALLHSRMPTSGCQACHGGGTTPYQECKSCHSPGYANTYTVPGTPSANASATAYPSVDDSITPTWTYTTTPAGQPVHSVVNAPYPPSTTTDFVTITSNTAGGVRFGFVRPTIPGDARITDVRIYAKGKATNTTSPRRLQGVFKIGGQEYLSANQGANLTTLWTAGAGQSFYSPSNRLDYTREPLYGEMIFRNPMTGQDWTPAEINGTDPDSSLDGFGVDLSASAGANNVSLTQIYLKVTYYTVGPDVTNPTVGTHTYHGDNVKYLHDPSDVPAGQRFVAVEPAHGWYEALYYQDCYDFCHRGNGGDPTFSANQGTWMWYSVGGDPTDSVVATRTLALRPVTIPADSPVLTFSTNYRLGTGAAGYVEVSSDDGGSWTPLTGTVGGASMSSVTGSAAGWTAASYDLSAYAGQPVRIRFRYVNGSSTLEGWAFDSLTIGGAGGPVFTDDAETLKSDWTNTYWTRSMGAFPF